jgi:hypothetical protein
MALTVITPTTNPDRTPVGGFGAVIPGTPDSVVTFPAGPGTVSLGASQIASGIINLLPGSGSTSTGEATVVGLAATDIVITSIDTDASGSSRFFVKSVHGTDTITANAYDLTGSSYVECHYVVFRP